jgi:hypothetical protein
MVYYLCQTVSGAYSVISKPANADFSSTYVFCKEITEKEAEKANKCLKVLGELLRGSKRN